MNELKITNIKGKLYLPPLDSHKGQNGKLLIIGGSKLFHAASLWAAKIASRIVDMVFYHSVEENLEIIKSIKKEFHDGIVVTSSNLEEYIKEADCILIGPGLPRGDDFRDYKMTTGEMVYQLLTKYPEKRYVLDASALQEMKAEWLKIPKEKAIVTPHRKEFEKLFKCPGNEENVRAMAQKYSCVILLKGPTDIVCSPKECKIVIGGNAGMTKGGTGDVLAGLAASLYTKNEAPISALAASYVNKKAGEALFEKVGLYFNASDLIDQIPIILKELNHNH